ncbi:DUF6048 family protein [uncultured Bacteroides sp.]|uniref:DUF6048 family protein n=1 Tax=uncultured Bacteroides sp. TaxID=162156 RepID=UPI002AA71651|nr:DUF6048 family protein [uncultured Bacteroides sp.]
MGQKILNFSINILLLILFLSGSALPLQAQSTRPSGKKVAKKEVKEVFPFYNGTYIGADLYGAGSNLLGGDFLSSEVSIDVNLKNRFFPVAEIGYGKTDTWSDDGIHYKSGAPYFRLGMNYNTMYNKRTESFFYVGLRYGASSFSYDIETLPITDPVWKDSNSNPNLEDGVWGGNVPFKHKGLKGNMQWFELVAGVQVQVYKNFMMGWSVRMKYRTSSSASKYGDPWYVPGFGTYGSSQMGLTYSLIYKLPL